METGVTDSRTESSAQVVENRSQLKYNSRCPCLRFKLIVL
jgi:hypothetical protein